MKTIMFHYTCKDCGTVTVAPGLSDMAYGEFIMFDDVGNALYLNAIVDSVFSELKMLVSAALEKHEKIRSDEASDVLQYTFGVTCDLSPDQKKYSIKTFPPCCKCGSKKMSSWGAAKPDAFSDELMEPSHDTWNKLTDDEKKILVEEEVSRILLDFNQT